MPKKLDLTGQRFNRLLVLEEGPKNAKGRTSWVCQCDCGVKKVVLTTQLTAHRTQSCGCLQRERTRLANQSEDLSGKRFGRLTVINRQPNSSLWKCRCDCGNEVITDTNHLNMGHTQSCGCLQKEITSKRSFKDLTGQRFGKLLVLKLDVERSTPKEKYYICQCDCGTIKSIRASNLRNGLISCGCEKQSSGELKINNLLTANGIPFTQEQTFADCINPKTNKLLRFDFFVNNSYLIEYNGIQHYQDKQMDHWGEPLQDIQHRDNLKIEWAQEHNIPLIIIPYTKYDTLSINDLLLS